MRRLLVPLLTGLALVAGPVALAAPATAETLVVVDAKKDVREMNMETGSETKQPSVRDHDITRTRISHGPKALVVRVKHRSLLGPKQGQGTFLRIVTSNREEYAAQWYRLKGAGTFVEFYDEDFETVECNVKVVNRPQKALRTFRVPRSCLGNPRWVRINSASMTGRKNRFFMDSGLGSGEASFNRLTRRVRVG